MRRPSLSTQVLLGLGLGILAGVFFGEATSVLDVVGEAFIKLLQMTVLPYVIVSLIAGLGRLDYREARTLALRAGGVLLLLWSIALVMVVLLPLALPVWASATFFSTSLVEERAPFDFVGFYIPANPFYAMGHSVVPGVVLFSVAVGVALIGMESRHRVIDLLDVMSDALMRVAQFVASLAPYGVFALVASAAGTMSLEELARLQVYLISYAAAALLLAFWVLPGLVATVTPLHYRNVVGRSRDAIITAFATGNLLIVLPMLMAGAKDLLRDPASEDDDGTSPVNVLVPVSFNFPSMGKLLTLSFLPFAAWFVGSSIPAAKWPSFLLTGTFSFFGPTVMAVPFLLDFLRVPADMFQLFVSVDVLASRFGVMLAAMYILTIALLGTCAMTGRVVFRATALLRFAGVTVLLMAATVGGARLFFSRTIDPGEGTYRVFVELEPLFETGPAKIHESPPDTPLFAHGSRLDAVRDRGSLRVCYGKDALPYAFVNASSRLVGFDVEMAHALAGELGVQPEFIRIGRNELEKSLNSGACDIAMTGVAMTPQRAQQMTFSTSYQEGTLAFIIEDHRRDHFDSFEKVRKLDAPRIAVPDVPYFISLVGRMLPDAKLVPIDSPRRFFREGELDALVLTAEAGSAWTLIYPGYSVAVPLPNPIRVPMAYPMPKGEEELADFVDTWIELKRGDHTIDWLYEHWILGQAAKDKKRRWSVIRDVLGWVD